MKIFVINPGSTSTKLALFEDENILWEEKIPYSGENLLQYESIFDQYDFRLRDIKEIMEKKGLSVDALDAIVGRGGLAIKFNSGAYEVNPKLIEALKSSTNQHISTLGGILAYDLASGKIPAFIYDPVSVDELSDVARISGLKGIERVSMAHFLNMRACCIAVAKEEGKSLEDLNFITAHLGGGISMLTIINGKAVDVVSDDEGPFTPERAGGLQLWKYTEFAFKHDEKTVKKMLRGRGGMMSYLGTQDMIEIEKMIEDGNEEAKLLHDAMAYQIAKSIASLAPVSFGKVDKIIITGGVSHSKMLVDKIKKRVEFLGEVVVMPGEREMQALSQGAIRVLKGEEKAHIL